MQFLDAIGLAYFWEKIKNWANSRFFSKEGGEISPGQGLHYVINGEHLGITISGNENETIHSFPTRRSSDRSEERRVGKRV